MFSWLLRHAEEKIMLPVVPISNIDCLCFAHLLLLSYFAAFLAAAYSFRHALADIALRWRQDNWNPDWKLSVIFHKSTWPGRQAQRFRSPAEWAEKRLNHHKRAVQSFWQHCAEMRPFARSCQCVFDHNKTCRFQRWRNASFSWFRWLSACWARWSTKC